MVNRQFLTWMLTKAKPNVKDASMDEQFSLHEAYNSFDLHET
jgi:hypothetical protein